MAKKGMIGASIGLDGEKEFKQAINGINSDMKVLSSEMKKVTSEFKDNANSVSALTAKQKVLNEQIEQQKRKVEELRKALNNSAEQYGENDERTKKWKISLNNAESQLNDLNSELRQNDRALDSAKSSSDGFANSLDNIDGEAKKAGASTLKMGDIIKANLISDAIIQGVKMLAGAIKDIATQSISAADEIASLSAQTGFSTDEIQAWQYVGKALDVEIGTITGSLSKLTRSMTSAKKGTGDQADAFKALKVSVTNSDGSLRDSKTVMLEVLEALGKVTNETERDSLAMQLFGKSATELNPLINAGTESINALTQAAYDNGAVMSGDTISGLDGFNDSMALMNQEITALVGEILVALMPTFQELIAWFRDNKEEIKKFATEAVQKVVDVIDWFIKNKDTAVLAVEAIGGAMLLASGPLGAVVASFGLLALNWDKMNNSEKIVGALGAVAVAAGAAAIAVGALQSAWTLGIAAAAIVAGTLAIAWAINSSMKKEYKKPDAAGGGIGGSGGGQWNAEGGIFTKPTMFATPSGYQGVGEAGAEAIIPLSKFPDLVGQTIDYDMMASAIIRAQRQSPAVAVIDKDYFESGVNNIILKAV